MNTLEEAQKVTEKRLKMNILQEAQKVTHGIRRRDYDYPEVNISHVARIATAILKREVTPQEIVYILWAIKFSRETHKHKRDNLVDIAGYAWCLSRIEGDENDTKLSKIQSKRKP